MSSIWTNWVGKSYGHSQLLRLASVSDLQNIIGNQGRTARAAVVFRRNYPAGRAVWLTPRPTGSFRPRQ
jgi:hypothetical protein